MPLSILLTIQIENSGACAWPTVSSRLRKSPQLEAMLTPGEVAAMPRAPNSAVPMTRAMSLGPGPAILIREPRRSYRRPRRIRHPAGAGGGDRAALRKANLPGAGARVDEKVGEAGVIGDYFS